MEPTNRRDFLKHASVAVAVTGAAVAAPVTIADAASALSGDKKVPPAPIDAKVDRNVVAHLRDVQTGEVDIYTGDSAITVKDKRLAALLYKASR